MHERALGKNLTPPDLNTRPGKKNVTKSRISGLILEQVNSTFEMFLYILRISSTTGFARL